MECCIHTRRGLIRCRNILPFYGDVSILPDKVFTVVGWGRGLLAYPWDPMESIGGLVAQGFKPVDGSTIHVYGEDGHILAEDYRGGLILDVRVDGLARGDPELVYLLVSRGEVGVLYEHLAGDDTPFSILRGDTGYWFVVLTRSAVDRRRVVKGLSRFVDRERIGIWGGRVDRLPSVSERYLEGGVKLVNDVGISRDHVPGNLIYYSWPMGAGLLGGDDEED